MTKQAFPVPTGQFSRERASLATGKATGLDRLLTPKEAAHFLRVSVSWLAKARMRGDGPPYIRIGRSIRYAEAALFRWMKGGSACRRASSRSSPSRPAPKMIERTPSFAHVLTVDSEIIIPYGSRRT
jgi:predicted DNA-binding transcriptional regulator AlpA